ncbi:MAG: glutathione peroxidase [Pseudomonadota bacterium]
MKHLHGSAREVFAKISGAVTRRRSAAAAFGAALLLAAPPLAVAPHAAATPMASLAGSQTAANAHRFTLPGIDGEPLPLAQFRGQPILVVNTASHCGFTGQYEGLQALWSAYRDQGLMVIGAPSDDFNQEYGSAAEVKAFCEGVFAVDFPLTDILHVKGADAHPFFAWAAAQSRAPSWNFNKYLIGADGALIRHYPSSATPAKIERDIKALLNGA